MTRRSSMILPLPATMRSSVPTPYSRATASWPSCRRSAGDRMPGKIHAAITDKPIDIAVAHAFVADAGHGAVNSFVGVVRDKNLGRDVTAVSYDVFEPLAEKILRGLCEKVREEHGGRINIWLAHYKGRLAVGGISVAIVVSTPHRAESFTACRA